VINTRIFGSRKICSTTATIGDNVRLLLHERTYSHPCISSSSYMTALQSISLVQKAREAQVSLVLSPGWITVRRPNTNTCKLWIRFQLSNRHSDPHFLDRRLPKHAPHLGASLMGSSARGPQTGGVRSVFLAMSMTAQSQSHYSTGTPRVHEEKQGRNDKDKPNSARLEETC
jgi:hypothetical protein